MKTENGYYVWTKRSADSAQLASYHFKLGEFECPCTHAECSEQKLSLDLITRLESLRRNYGKPLTITGGFRCPAHEDDLRKQGRQTVAPGHLSQHCSGNAADVAAAQMTTFYAEAEKLFKAIGLAPRWAHLDIRDDKQRRWRYT